MLVLTGRSQGETVNRQQTVVRLSNIIHLLVIMIKLLFIIILIIMYTDDYYTPQPGVYHLAGIPVHI